jgi:hypothetical protein
MTKVAMAYRDLPDIDDVQAFDESDEQCLSAIKDVLDRFGKLERFGVTLLHSHFPIYEGEALVETCDDETRTLVSQVVADADMPEGRVVETMWRLTDDSTIVRCVVGKCVQYQGSKHRKQNHTRMTG